MDHWLEEIARYAPKDVLICILGNKADLVEEKVITYETAKVWLSESHSLDKQFKSL